VESVSCLTLSRADFRLLTNLKGKLLEAQAARGANNNSSGFKTNADLIQTSSLANKRRISALNTHGHRDEMRINNLFKRFSKFTTETLWNSLYSRLYRELLLDPSKQTDYGTIAEEVMHENEQRYPTVQVWIIVFLAVFMVLFHDTKILCISYLYEHYPLNLYFHPLPSFRPLAHKHSAFLNWIHRAAPWLTTPLCKDY